MPYQHSHYDPSVEPDKHPGYPVQDSFSDLDSPRLFSPMMKVLDPECYGIMRMETGRWRAIHITEIARNVAVKRIKALRRSARIFGNAWKCARAIDCLKEHIIDMDKDHADLVREDAIEPGYNFKALED